MKFILFVEGYTEEKILPMNHHQRCWNVFTPKRPTDHIKKF